MLYLCDMEALRTFLPLFLALCIDFSGYCQALNEITNAPFLKSISFKALEGNHQFPLVQQGESFVLQFDDLLAQENDYYYRIEYCNHDWTPSNLFKNEFLEGFDNQRISNYRSSYGTLQRYTHYELTLPNEKTQFKLSGNYMISVFDSSDELMFSRKFLIHENLASIEGVESLLDAFMVMIFFITLFPFIFNFINLVYRFLKTICNLLVVMNFSILILKTIG